MDIKDKLVNLGTLKTFYNGMLYGSQCWEDASDTLTFGNATLVYNAAGDAYAYSGSDTKSAIISVQPGEEYRYWSWGPFGYNQTGSGVTYYLYPMVVRKSNTNSSDDILITANRQTYDRGTGSGGTIFLDSYVVIPDGYSYLVVYNYSHPEDIIFERRVLP